ncbi:MAG TPA: type II secretion system protein GspG, partial [Prosthecobacter sp.]|nr:type II secretion system protein GspG [Prosthecobacter sp.]
VKEGERDEFVAALVSARRGWEAVWNEARITEINAPPGAWGEKAIVEGCASFSFNYARGETPASYEVMTDYSAPRASKIEPGRSAQIRAEKWLQFRAEAGARPLRIRLERLPFEAPAGVLPAVAKTQAAETEQPRKTKPKPERELSPEDKTKWVQAQADLNTIRTALASYERLTGALPTSEQGLKALVEKPETGPVPDKWRAMLAKGLLTDPWGKAYGFSPPGRFFGLQKPMKVFSYGPDGVESDDDLGTEESGAVKPATSEAKASAEAEPGPSGKFKGEFVYGRTYQAEAGKKVPMEVWLEPAPAASNLKGSCVEPYTGFGKTGPDGKMHAKLSGRWRNQQGRMVVTLEKTYLHFAQGSCLYEGTYDTNSGQISGSWKFSNGQGGTFSLKRAK